MLASESLSGIVVPFAATVNLQPLVQGGILHARAFWKSAVFGVGCDASAECQAQ